jgi:hypothetical protein
MAMTDAAPHRLARLLVLAVVVLGLPAVTFVLSHLILEQFRIHLPEWLDLVLVWTLVVTGMLGAFTTVGAVLVAIVASFLASVSAKGKVLMWTVVAVSLLAVVYLARVRP